MPTQAALTVAEAAEELDTTELNISRLYARGDLKAHRLGATGQLRIMSEDLNNYIAAGAPNFCGFKRPVTASIRSRTSSASSRMIDCRE